MDDKRDILSRPQTTIPSFFSPMITCDTYSEISESCLSGIPLKTQDIHMKEMPIIEGISPPSPHMSISEDTQPHILETCLDDDTLTS